MNETLSAILEIPLVLRTAIVMFIIWCVYAGTAGLLLRIVMFIPILLNGIWVFIYKLFNSLIHILHRKFGQALAGVDQTVTDFFGSVYGFFNRIKTAIETRIKDKKLFRGATFIIIIILTVWIALPTWLNIEQEVNFFTAAYRKYIEIERSLLDMIFSDST